MAWHGAVHQGTRQCDVKVRANFNPSNEALFRVPCGVQVPEGAAPAMALLKQVQADIMQGTGCVIGSGGKTVG